VEPVLTFGLGEAETVALTVTWPDGTRQHVEDVRANQTITLHQQEAQPDEPNPDEPNPDEPDRRFKQKSPDKRGLAFTHQENRYEDYREEPLMLHMLARLGPALARGDVNGDGRDDVFVGGARGSRLHSSYSGRTAPSTPSPLRPSRRIKTTRTWRPHLSTWTGTGLKTCTS